MDVLYPRCAGLDVHQKTVVACVRIHGEAGKAKTETRTFPTHTAALIELSQWLTERECTHVAMEATGVYWKPVWHILEGNFELVLANARHVRNVPGRKSDVNDAAWLADLLAHGLVRSSFVPPQPIQELRDLTRTRKQLVRQRAQHVNRLHKVLEDANIKVGSLITDITGKSGRAILSALIAGEQNPQTLVQLTHARLKTPKSDLMLALQGKVTAHHRFLLQMHLDQIDGVDRSLEKLDTQIEEQTRPFAKMVDQLQCIPGMSVNAARVVLAEIGPDMSHFSTAARLVSFAGLCPRMDESAGKKNSVRLRKGSAWLKTTLVSCAWAAARSKNTYARAQFHRIKTRRGSKRAVVAVAASMLTSIYYLLKRGTDFVDPGPTYFDQRDRTRMTKRLQKRLEALGYNVQLTPVAA
ncbi:MAG TPA: IS110 family transposase [Polyangiales bacterium]|jgi:transposase|nr:IS110 family transposase [Polyangiales bacterium]